MRGAIAKAEEITPTTPGAVIPQQFENPANPEIHRRTTAEEIWNDTGGEIDVFVSGIGTGGTITGVGQVLKPRKPEPPHRGGRAGGQPGAFRRRAGPAQDPGHRRRLRAGRSSTPPIYDEVVTATNEEAFTYARLAARLEGIPVGISSGAAIAAALKVGRRPQWTGKNIVIIIPSFAERYLSTALFEGLDDVIGR